MSEVSEESPLNHPVVHSTMFLAYLTVFVGATVGNIVILTVFYSQRRSRSVTNFFLANLTVADLLVGIFCVLQNGAHFLSEDRDWPFGGFLCYTYIYTLHMLPNVSAGILVLISVERLVAVYRPLKVRRYFRRKVLVTSAAFVWIGSAVMNIPYFYASQHREFIDDEGKTLSMCTRSHVTWQEINVLKLVTIVNFVVWYATPLLTLLFIYAAIGLVVSRAADISNSARDKLISNGSNHSKIGCRTESSSGGVSIEKRRKVGRLSLGIVSSFALCSLPRYVYLMWTVWRDPTAPRCLNCFQTVLQPISFLLLFLNSALNPFLYAFLSIRFRQCIKDTFKCKRKREVPLELKSQAAARVRQPPASEENTGYDDIRYQ